MSDQEQKIISLLQKELGAEEAQKVRDEMERSSDLKKEFQQYQDLDTALRNATKLTMSAEKTQAILEGAKRAHKAQSYTLLRFVSAACLVFAIGFIVYQANFVERAEPKVETVVLNQNNTKNSLQNDAYHWLTQNQSDDGTWDPTQFKTNPNYKTGLTALSLLAFLDKSEKTSSDNEVIQKSISWLLSHQNEKGLIGPKLNNDLYNHGIATYSLIKAYEQKIQVPLDSIRLALDHIKSKQDISGGWGYAVDPDSLNTSISIWQLQSLLLANKLKIQDNLESIQNGFRWVESNKDQKGVLGYRKQGDFPYGKKSLAAMSGIFYQYHDILSIDRVEAKISFHKELEALALSPSDQLNYYQCYFLADNMKHLKSTNNQELADRIEKIIQHKQLENGSWNPDDQWGFSGGRLYATSMALMALNSLQTQE